MASNVYLAFGSAGGQPVMKVGKANDARQREHQIGIRMSYVFPCVDEHQAFILESQFRQLARKLGAVRIKGHIDWFQFDTDIYQRLSEAIEDDAFTGVQKALWEAFNLAEREISEFQTRYRVLLREDALELRDPNRYAAELDKQVRELESEIERIKRETDGFLCRLIAVEVELELWQSGRLTPPASKG